MKKIALTLCALSIVAFSFGQTAKDVKLDKGKMQLNLGVGLSTWGLPVYLGVDYWLNEDITLGLEASARYNLRWSYGSVGGSVNANYHANRILQLPDNVDLYAGLSAGPYISFGSYWTNNFHIGIGGQIGGRYKINDKMWIHGEVGGGTFSGAKIGITVRR